MVGSTALVQVNETQAHQRIQGAFRRFSEIIASHGGTAHETRGDALVAEFSKASDAVSAAVAFQTANTAHNDGLGDEVLPVIRVGIAMGEVVVADNTVTGEGIVLAQRLEQLAEPGGVYIHDAAYQTVPKRLPFEYENLGEHRVKGFEEPVKVYAARQSSSSTKPDTHDSTQHEPDTLTLPDKPSIAVLPFTNMSGDPEQEYFSDGITEDIITALSRFRELFVICRHTSFVFKGQSVDVISISKQLGVRYVVEGSVRRVGNTVRITAQLIDATTGNHVWAERYDRELEHIFAMQDEVTANIVSMTAGQVAEIGRQRATEKSTENLAAYDCFLRGEHHLAKGSMTDLLEARRMYERAIELDPRHAQSWAGLALTYMWEDWSGWTTEPNAAVERCFELAEKAVAVDERESRAHLVLADACVFARRDFDRARIEIGKAVELNPNDYSNLCFMGYLHALDGRADEGIACASTAFRLNPYAAYGCRIAQFLACFAAGAYDDASTALQNISSSGGYAQACLAACYAKLGRLEDAKRLMGAFMEEAKVEFTNYPDEDSGAWREYWTKFFPFRNTAVFDDLMDSMRESGLLT